MPNYSGSSKIRKILSVAVVFLFVSNSISVATPPQKDSLRQMSTALQTRAELKEELRKLSPVELYKLAFSNTPDMDILIANDIDEVGNIFAAEKIKEMQHYMRTVPKNQDIIIHYCTGVTPWIGDKKALEWLKSWDTKETQEILERYGVDTTFKPDVKRLIAEPLDAIFPQKRDAYFSFANILDILFKDLGIRKKKRRLFYGDLIAVGKGRKLKTRRMSEKEFDRLIKDIENRGLLLREFLNGQLDKDDIQYRHLKAMQMQADELREEIEKKGGAHIFLSGLGPSYTGESHVAFNISGTDFDRKAWIGLIDYYIAAAHCPENISIDTLYTKDGKPKYGFITFGLADLLYRQRHGGDETVLLIVTGDNKAEAVRIAIEGKPDRRYPVTALQESKGKIILDRGSAYKLRLKTHPWDFEVIEDWSEDMIEDLFCQLSLDAGTPIHKLEIEEHFINQTAGKDEDATEVIRDIRRANLDNLTKATSWQELREKISKKQISKLTLPEEFPQKIKLKKKGKAVYISPHPDDDVLAELAKIRTLVEQGYEVVTYYMTKGYRSVADSFMFALLERMGGFSDEEIAKLKGRSLKEVAKKLCRVCEAKTKLHGPADNFYPWESMEEDEKLLRAQAVFLQLRDLLKKDGLEIDSEKKLSAVVDFLTGATKQKPAWDSQDLDIVIAIKTFIRDIEVKTALLSIGVEYKNIHSPLEATYYKPTGGRGTTAEDVDIRTIRDDIIEKERPDLLVGNGEDHSDYATHASVEVSTYVALLDLLTSGRIKAEEFVYMQYAGVWMRIPVQKADMLVVLTKEQFDDLNRLFINHFPSQAPAPQPDPGIGKMIFFSEQVANNGYETADELETLLGERLPDWARNILQIRGSGVLGYKIVDLKKTLAKIQEKADELIRVRKAKRDASNEEMQGSPAHKPTITYELVQILEEADIELKSIVKESEIAQSRPGYITGMRDATKAHYAIDGSA